MNKRIRRKHEKQMAELEALIARLRVVGDAAALAAMSMAAVPAAILGMGRAITARAAETEGGGHA